MESFLVLLYGVAFVVVIYYMMQLTAKPGPKEAVITVEDASTNDASTNDASTNDASKDASKASKDLWPWSITKYSFWPQWFNNKDGFGHPGHPNDFGHEGGYGYTGRQDPRWDCSFEGDGQGKDMLGGNFARSGMIGYTGREPRPHCTTQLPYNEFRKVYEDDDKKYNEFKKLYEDEKDEKDEKDKKDKKTK